eukprot:CAMPEP_0198137426 /NCGR_PEP_ID=MMETSP1443-20131203/905_1 /TAXON_ID=186043 /ORGANISM="Entomoneis sp., Strain CCMP2396" /LENGTH=266 /DNA_ID=CAMNT_0043798835 /DNA_START=86 /DNA_END=886 /DNA_ORIENTATION=-
MADTVQQQLRRPRPYLGVLKTVFLVLVAFAAKKQAVAAACFSLFWKLWTWTCSRAPNYPSPPLQPLDIDDASIGGGSLSLDDIYDHLGCEDIWESTRPLYNETTWGLLRETYQRQHVWEILNVNFVPRYYAAQTRDKGRGVFASRDIKKGEIVCSGSSNYAVFHSGSSYRKFVFALPADSACDAMEWSWVESQWENGEAAIFICLDEASLVNSGSRKEPHNIGCPLANTSECQFNDYALRDIASGEEILCDYSSFANPEGWKQFGL